MSSKNISTAPDSVKDVVWKGVYSGNSHRTNRALNSNQAETVVGKRLNVHFIEIDWHDKEYLNEKM